jgi:hypothetical protein
MDFIQKLQFEINFFSQTAYPAFEERFMALVNKTLLPEIEKILATALPPNQLLRIEELTIDLESIDYQDFEEKMTYQFIEKLIAALKYKINILATQTTQNYATYAHTQAGNGQTTLPIITNGKLSKKQTNLEILCYFLEHGILPWWVKTQNFKGIDELIKEIETEEPQKLRQIIWQKHNNLTWQKRLSTQVSEDVLFALLLPPKKNETEEQNLQKLASSGLNQVLSSLDNYLFFLFQQLKNTSPQTKLRQTLLAQLTEKQLVKLVQIAKPSEANFICRYAHDLLTSHNKKPFTNADNQTFRKARWEFIFNYIFEDKSSRFNRKMFIANVLKQMAARFNVSYQSLLAELTFIALETKKSLKLNSLLPDILQELQEQENGKTFLQTKQGNQYHQAQGNINFENETQFAFLKNSNYASNIEQTKTAQKQFLFELLANILENEQLESQELDKFKLAWEVLLQHYFVDLEQVIKNLGSKAANRSRLVSRFSVRQIGQLIKLLEPNEVGFILHYAQDLQTIQEQKNIVKTDKHTFRQAKWEFIFAYLFVDRGSFFNRKAFIRSTIQNFANRFNTSYAVLLLFLTQNLQQNFTAQQANSLQLGTLLLDLLQDLNKEQAARQEPNSEKLQKFWTVSAQRQTLKHLLLYGIFPYQILQKDIAFYTEILQKSQKITYPKTQSFASPQVAFWAAPVFWADKAVFVPVLLALKDVPVVWQKLVQELDKQTLQHILLSLSAKFVLENQVVAFYLLPQINENNLTLLASYLNVYLQMATKNNFQFFAAVPQIIKKWWLQFCSTDIQRFIANLPLEKQANTIKILQIEFSQKNEENYTDVENKKLFGQQVLSKQFIEKLGKEQKLPYLNNAKKQEIQKILFSFSNLFLLQSPEIELVRNFLNFSTLALASWQDQQKATNLLNNPSIFFAMLQHIFIFFLPFFAGSQKKISKQEIIFVEILLLFLQKNYKQDTSYFLSVVATQGFDNFAKIVQTSNFVNLQNLPTIAHYMRKNFDRQQNTEQLGAYQILKQYFDYQADTSYKVYSFATLEQLFVKIVEEKNLQLLLELLPTQKFRSADTSHIRNFSVATWTKAANLYNPLQFKQIWHYSQLFWQALGNVPPEKQAIFRSLQSNEKQIAFVWYVLAAGYAGSISTTEILAAWLIFSALHTNLDKEEIQTLLLPTIAIQLAKSPDAALQKSIEKVQYTKIGTSKKEKRNTKENIATQQNKVKKQENITFVIPETIYVENAGLVLLSPYFVVLFSRLGLVEKSEFPVQDNLPNSRQKALHVLQYLVNEGKNSAEYDLALNKLLCGMEMGEVAEKAIDLVENDRQMADGLLTSVIKQWAVLQNSSLTNFRVSFLQRAGRLTFHATHWELHVEQRGYDVLIDKIPWSFHLVKLAWMPLPLFVYWRNK